jgi:hypothetical protein
MKIKVLQKCKTFFLSLPEKAPDSPDSYRDRGSLVQAQLGPQLNQGFTEM